MNLTDILSLLIHEQVPSESSHQGFDFKDWLDTVSIWDLG